MFYDVAFGRRLWVRDVIFKRLSCVESGRDGETANFSILEIYVSAEGRLFDVDWAYHSNWQ